MVTISLCMIVKNEELTLGRCLESVHDLVDEIIIVDTGSTDKTKQIAKEYKAKTYNFKWIDDFSAARNVSFSKATQDYIFWLDADDVLLEEDREKFKKTKETMDNSIDVVMMKYNLGADDKGNALCTFYRERLLKRTKKFTWYDPIHEYMILSGKIVSTDIAITHKKMHGKTDRNLKIFEKILAEGKKLSHRNMFYYARELYSNGRYDEAIEYYNKFMDTEDGMISNYTDASLDLYNCYKIKKDDKNSFRALTRSFEHGEPRAEICCQIGYYYKNLEKYNNAIFWFEAALNVKKPENSWGSVIHDSYGYIPCMELCACYFKAGKLVEAIKYNKMAGEHKPNDPSVLQNTKYLQSIYDNVKESKNISEEIN